MLAGVVCEGNLLDRGLALWGVWIVGITQGLVSAGLGCLEHAHGARGTNSFWQPAARRIIMVPRPDQSHTPAPRNNVE